MRHVAFLLLLAACAAPEPAPLPSFRDASLPVASTSRTVDLGGEWVVSQALPGGPWGELRGGGLGVAAGTWTVRRADGSMAVLNATQAGPGRYRIGGGPDLWVLWADDDGRTAVLAAPDGTAAFVLDRPGQSSADRATAAREVLNFNGFDVSRLSA